MFQINKIVKNFFSVGFANLISQLLAFLIIAYYARILGKADFGVISLAQSILVYFTMITLFGFQTYGTREVAKRNNSISKLTGDIITLRFLIATICFVVITIIGIVSNKGLPFIYIMVIYGATLFPIAFNIDWVFSGLQEMQHNAIYNIIKNLVPFILIMLFFKSKKDIYLIPLFTVIGTLAGIIYQAYIYKFKNKLKYNFFNHSKNLRIYITIALPFLISSLLSMINCNVDSVIIGFMRSDEELGIYSSAYKIVFFLMNIVAVVFTPLFPVMIDYFTTSRDKLNEFIKYICKIVIMISVPICIGGILLSKEIIVLLFSKEYIDAHVTFSILMIYILLLFMRETYGYGLNAWNMEKQYLKSVSISAFANIILNLIFIPMYGITAAAITTVISEVINFLFMRRYSLKIVKTNYLYNIKKIMAPTIIMSLIIIVMKRFGINVLIIITSAIVVYFISILKFKYVTLEEVKKILVRKNGV